ncbi:MULTISPECIES: 2-phospho-L-lactate guanylyltransferase [unclassified Mesorhizobium]|uniref:2-phospho-L-lactate guanylyltransferase n=1 Tax=unclassified Mesorhizobium TaxID=325217 RepID=UPI0011275286|nr:MULTISPECIES: 2-phospho-L-lactate guanylyltransferase [unclassified Mesorhizobium]MBZ9810981.1 2-phospho-L-lactate guanylyltransferase [Mesorhizobium sp. ESP-6-2]TPM27762.1 2-phospho-L-lactate guanylyltransferase [Mesorhizobium sp. B2-2-2]
MTRAARLPVSGAWALVPVKPFGLAKSRLGALLSAAERNVLAQAMLKDVMEALWQAHGLNGVLVVTSDPEAQSIARSFGAKVLNDPLDTGTNTAVELGLRYLAKAGASRALVVPGDIPFIVADEIEAALFAMDWNPVVLAPARRDGGTNLLGLRGPDVITPAFGPDSFARHLAAAKLLGLEPAILQLSGASNDIDVPGDLMTGKLAGGPARRTRALLARITDLKMRASTQNTLELSRL